LGILRQWHKTCMRSKKRKRLEAKGWKIGSAKEFLGLSSREEDERRIESLKRRLGIARKVDVLRAGMDLLEKEAERRERVRRWKCSAALVAGTSRAANADFQPNSRLKRI
jgi:hypothetical protein